MDGIINVLKPPGMTSHDVIDYVRRTLKIKKAGHTGTLDPAAAGVLIVCVGRVTRAARFFVDCDKEYRAEITFGVTTYTGDSLGMVISQKDASHLTKAEVLAALPAFTGEIMQVPPMVSALKRQGKKLYELAREGVTVERQARAVTIKSLEYISGNGWGTGQPTVLLHLTCSKGTYVRSLCEDLGNFLGCGAHMSFLVRTRVGNFHIADSCTIEDLYCTDIFDIIIPAENALLNMPEVKVKSGAVRPISSGSRLYLPGVSQLPEGLKEGMLVRLKSQEELLAVAETGLDPEDRSRIVFKPICVLV